MTTTEDTTTRTRFGIELVFDGDKVTRTDNVAAASRFPKTDEFAGGWVVAWNDGRQEGPFAKRPQAVLAMTVDGKVAQEEAKKAKAAAKVENAKARAAAKKEREKAKVEKAKEREKAKKEREKAKLAREKAKAKKVAAAAKKAAAKA